jgi:hypothetical protein
MTYMGKPYYPVWLDNLADDVTIEAAAMDGTARGPDDVRAIVGTARALYDQQEFRFAGPVGDDGFVEDYNTHIRGVDTNVVVWITFNAAGQTQQVVVNHRPRSALLSFSRVLREKFGGTHLAKHWQDTP